MTWTTDTPTKPGWYNRRCTEVVDVALDADTKEPYPRKVLQLVVEWAGPLEPPKER